jgi:hypothetical protein
MPPDPALLATAKQAAAAYGIPENLFIQQIQTESGFNPNPPSNPQWPQSAGGPIGIAQFIPGTAAQYKVNPYDPTQSLWGAAAYDADLYKKSGSWAKVLSGYGTVPATGPQNPQQAATLAAAQAADSGTSGNPSVNPLLTPVGGPGSGAAGAPSTGGSSHTGSLVLDWIIRVVVILVGIVLVWQGLAMMRGSNVHEDITVVVKGARGRVQKNAA